MQEQGETPLYAATSAGHVEIVQLLLEAEVDKNQATVCTLDGGGPQGSVFFGSGSTLCRLSGVDGAAVCIA